MRRSLAIRSLIVSALIVLVFSVPLGILLATQASDRAVSLAATDTRSLVPIVSVAGDTRLFGALTLVATQAAPREVRIVFPDGSVLGADQAVESDPTPLLTKRALDEGSFLIPYRGGKLRLEPVVRTNSTTAVVRVFIPNSELRRNVTRNWLLLAAIGTALVTSAAFVADRLGRTVVRSVGSLDDTARALAQGRLDARIDPEGPPEVRQVGSTLNLLAGRIDELILLERAAVADLSHRLRTPVTALRAEAALIRDPEARPRIERGIEELTRMIDQIIRDAQQPIRSGLGIASDLGEVAARRAAFWGVLAEEQRRLFTVDIQVGKHPVPVVESDLVAMVDALLDNVFSHTAERIDFRLRVRSIGEDVELVVDDHGAGVPDGFDPVRGTSAAGSTGLGLDIVRKTCEAAGGSLALRNRARGGARVRVTLPRVGERSEPVVR
jgi:signal transduction histidine kinase